MNSPKQFTIQGKTFRVKDGTVLISMYDTVSRITKLQAKAREYGLTVIYTK